MAPVLSRLLSFCKRISTCTSKLNVQYIQIAGASRSQLGKPGEFRMDKDTLGEIRVPAEKYYGSETMRSILNFQSGGDTERMPFPLISAIGIIKKAAANVNKDYGLDSQVADAIVKASEEVMCGELYCEHFPLVIWQAGASTNSHINANEVIANRAIEIMGGEIGSKKPVHPNDHVNMGQSTNDVIPSAIHIALALELHNNTLPNIKMMQEELDSKSKEWDKIIKVGRTHLMDAVPISLGQEFCGYSCQVKDCIHRIEATLPGLYELQMGGTAVGTELNAGCGFSEKVAALIRDYTGLPFVTSPKKIAGCACLDHVVHLSAALSTLSCSLIKVVNDIRHMASGPRCGIYELLIPEKEPGSSIMPGKVNPTQCEAVLMISALTIGNHVATTIGGSLGNWELNLYKPLIFSNTLRSARLLGHVSKAFTKNLLKDMKPNEERICEMLNECLMLVTALNPHIGYDKAAKIAVIAHKEGLSLKEAAVKQGVSESDFDEWVKPEDMIHCLETSKGKKNSASGQMKRIETCLSLPEPMKEHFSSCKKKNSKGGKKKDPCEKRKTEKNVCKTNKSEKKDPCKTSKSQKKDPCKSSKSEKQDPCKTSKSEKKDPCKTSKSEKMDPCKSSKSEKKDPCKSSKSEKKDPCKSSKSEKKDPCKSSKSEKKDPCKSSKSEKKDPCKTKKSDKKDPCKTGKSEKKDPCKSSKSEKRDPCKTSKSEKKDPCKTKKSEKKDPCKTSKSEKKDPCKSSKPEKKDPCKTIKSEKKDPCKTKKSEKRSTCEPEKRSTCQQTKTEDKKKRRCFGKKKKSPKNENKCEKKKKKSDCD